MNTNTAYIFGCNGDMEKLELMMSSILQKHGCKLDFKADGERTSEMRWMFKTDPMRDSVVRVSTKKSFASAGHLECSVNITDSWMEGAVAILEDIRKIVKDIGDVCYSD